MYAATVRGRSATPAASAFLDAVREATARIPACDPHEPRTTRPMAWTAPVTRYCGRPAPTPPPHRDGRPEHP